MLPESRLNKKSSPPQNFSSKYLPLILCTVIGVGYCFDALHAPFFGGADTDLLSNLLPVVHYRYSILYDGVLPLHTNLWYGARAQWQNPLWSFLYLPATLVWMAGGLKVGTSILVCGHVIFILLAGWYLAGLFFGSTLAKFMGAILFAAPVAQPLKAGHIENIFAYPWILLGIYFLLDHRKNALKRGVAAGVCLGIAALAGANYYVLYAAILFAILILFQGDRCRLVVGFMIGALVGLPHIISVLYLVGVSRGNPVFSIPYYSEPSPLRMFSDFFLGIGASQRWGYLALIGVGMVPLLLLSILDLLKPSRTSRSVWLNEAAAPLLAFGVFALLASGLAYRGHHLLDTFRVPARALHFAALSLLLFVFLSVRNWAGKRKTIVFWMLLLSVIQVVFVLSTIRPIGGHWWLNNSGVEEVAAYLSHRNAKSVWVQTTGTDMLIHIALNIRGIGVPNAYYGDMGQRVVSAGDHCGLSFDYILLPGVSPSERVELKSSVPARQQVEGPSKIDRHNLRYLRDFSVEDELWSLYEVSCTG
jgi:hypothetical protein